MIVKAELCPVCHGMNIAGNKYCYGPVYERHDKTRFEFVEVVPVTDVRAVLSEQVGPDLASIVLRELSSSTKHPAKPERDAGA